MALHYVGRGGHPEDIDDGRFTTLRSQVQITQTIIDQQERNDTDHFRILISN